MDIKIANRLYEYRKANGFSQEELAEKIGVSRQAISKWERSESSPDTDNLIALAKLYQITLDELIHGESTPSKTITQEATPAPEPEAEQTKAPQAEAQPPLQDSVRITPQGVYVQSQDGSTAQLGYQGVQLGQNNTQQFNDHIFKHAKSKKAPWVSAVIWIVGILLFLVIGALAPHGWAVSWILFLLMPAVDSGIDAVLENKPQEFAYPLLVTALFCALGMAFSLWHPAWILFLTIPLYYVFTDSYKKSEEAAQGRTPLFITFFIIFAVVASSTLGIVCNAAFTGRAKSSTSVGTYFNYDDEEEYTVGSGAVSAAAVRELDIEWVNGSVTVNAADTDKITFTEEEQTDSDLALRYRLEEGKLKLQFCKSHIRLSSLENTAKHLTVTVPASAVKELDIDTVSAPVSISGVTLQKLEIDNVSGDIKAEGSFANVDVDTVSGGVNLVCQTAPDTIDFDTVSGNGTFALPSDIPGFRITYDTVSGEVIANDFFDEGTILQSTKNRTQIYGDGRTQIDFDTVSGDLTLSKA